MQHFLRNGILVVLLLLSCPVFADTLPLPAAVERTSKIDHLMEGTISRGLIAGGVVLIGDREGVLFERPYGRMSTEPDARPMTVDTIFDLASLTKVIATTPAILKLADEGRLSLIDPIVKWFPEFVGKGKDDLLVANLLTHTSGLDDFPLAAGNPLQSAINGAAAQKVRGEVWSRFRYADINFILLAELVRRVSGVGLDTYTAASFYAPLGMTDTGFNPDQERAIRCSATLGEGKSFFLGVPQDSECRLLGGVSGHAGLFSTARDLSRFCRMLLGEGSFEGTRILSERAVRQMTAPYFSRGGRVVRGLGWDIDSPFSSPKGSGFSEMSFGHTGYSGSSVWIDPARDTFVVLLTARLDYKKTREFNLFRSDLSSLAAELFGVVGNGERASSPP
ncbi:MAG TPA: serine hydrolase domain-containing protein [Geobacteraceae bacterium]|nr:serine hydrolase domain-containing protein [Geobacteraceae bacterium]